MIDSVPLVGVPIRAGCSRSHPSCGRVRLHPRLTLYNGEHSAKLSCGRATAEYRTFM